MNVIAPVPPVGTLKTTLPVSPTHFGWVAVAVKAIAVGAASIVTVIVLVQLLASVAV